MTVDAFVAARPRLLGIAYRMLGSRVEAEDVVGDVAERWARADQAVIAAPEGWLVTVTDAPRAGRPAGRPAASRRLPGTVAARADRHGRRPGDRCRAAGVADDGLPRAARAADADRARRVRPPRRARTPLRRRRRRRRAHRGGMPPGAPSRPPPRQRAAPTPGGRPPPGGGGRRPVPGRRDRRRARGPAGVPRPRGHRAQRRWRCRQRGDATGGRGRHAPPASSATSPGASARRSATCCAS